MRLFKVNFWFLGSLLGGAASGYSPRAIFEFGSISTTPCAKCIGTGDSGLSSRSWDPKNPIEKADSLWPHVGIWDAFLVLLIRSSCRVFNVESRNRIDCECLEPGVSSYVRMNWSINSTALISQMHEIGVVWRLSVIHAGGAKETCSQEWFGKGHQAEGNQCTAAAHQPLVCRDKTPLEGFNTDNL